jgi:uncharacterized damage-inducible protein DinB
MKDLLVQYASYNLWADEKMFSAINELEPGAEHREINSSFSSIYQTAFHIWRAGHMWWERLELRHAKAPEDLFEGSAKNIEAALLAADQRWIDWIRNSSEEKIREDLHYQNLRGEAFAEPICLILLHVFNHASYHRGQLVTMLRQSGSKTIPGTDFIAWVRESKRP